MRLNPSHLYARANELREGAYGEDFRVRSVVVVEHGLYTDRLEIEQLVGLVGTDDEVVLLCEGHEALTLRIRHRVAGRVVVHGHSVDHLDFARVLLQQLFQCVDIHAILLDRDTHEAHATVPDHGEREVVSGLLDDGDVASFAMHPAGDVRAHGSASGRHQSLRVHRQAVLVLEESSQRLTEGRMPQHVGAVRLVAIIQSLLRPLNALREALDQSLAKLRPLQKLGVRPALDEILRFGH
mmetsp:Transcript_66147/g.141555  ORF Transcript_66147/g.141555 Transcript_66147/m.141555 type:complete len:239 (+) Transcript_66147:513-1229(+)